MKLSVILTVFLNGATDNIHKQEIFLAISNVCSFVESLIFKPTKVDLTIKVKKQMERSIIT